MKRVRKIALIILISVLALVFLLSVGVLSVNYYVKSVGEKNMISAETAATTEGIECIIILGCGVRPDGSPSDMLRDRLEVGIELYKKGVAPKILMSGDHGEEYYDEVNTMKDYAIEQGVPSEDIFMDHAGFSTYESIYRAKEIFSLSRVVVVTQKYHLYRALYIAEQFQVTAFGVDAELQRYIGQDMRDLREVLARSKDFLTSIFKPEPTVLGDKIPVINQNGDITNDK